MSSQAQVERGLSVFAQGLWALDFGGGVLVDVGVWGWWCVCVFFFIVGVCCTCGPFFGYIHPSPKMRERERE